MMKTVNVYELLLGLLTILFIGLKLSGYIDWSWWWVLLPIWLFIAIGLLLFLFLLIFKKLIK